MAQLATPYLVQSYESIRDLLKAIPGEFVDKSAWSYINVWDSQIDEIVQEKGAGYAFGFPSVFVEIELGTGLETGGGVVAYRDCHIRIHVIGFSLNDGDDMEKNYDVFSLAQLIQRKFRTVGIKNCSKPQLFNFNQDWKHGNVYKLILDYTTNFVDKTGSILDEFMGVVGTISNINLVFKGLVFASEDLETDYEYEVDQPQNG